ncbi:MAG: replicative DNA helicase [Synergistaceae bacterium]|jgi:replicative DNA helicase|nr:replicative DNA helicase [Synergistaceae bacterium]
MAERIPPNNLEAERAVLGACLLEREALMLVVESLNPDDFYEPRHALTFEVMKEMASRDRAVDSLTFQEELARRSMLDRIGGISFVAMLLDSVTTTANIEHHCSIVRDKSIHRELIRVGADIARNGFAEEIDADEALAGAEQRVFEIARHGPRSYLKDISDIIVSAFEKIERSLREGATTSGLSSGFSDLDKLIGGFQPGSLNIIAARPSMGKTAFALNVAQSVAVSQNVPVLIFSLEMSAEQLAGRLLSAEARVNLRELSTDGNIRKDQWNALTDAVARLSRAPIFIDDSSTLSTLDLRSRSRRFFSKHKNEKCLVIVDYLQLMANNKRVENRQQEVSDISRALKGVAREFDAPVIALSQLSREVEKRGSDKRPVLSDLRDSGAIEQDADIVAFLYRPAYYQQERESSDPTAELAIAKHRNGPTGKIDLMFYKEYSRFENLAY